MSIMLFLYFLIYYLSPPFFLMLSFKRTHFTQCARNISGKPTSVLNGIAHGFNLKLYTLMLSCQQTTGQAR